MVPIYTESTQTTFRTTQSLHRAIKIYTESTQSTFRTTQSLHRAIQFYTESTQSDLGLHRIYTEPTVMGVAALYMSARSC